MKLEVHEKVGFSSEDEAQLVVKGQEFPRRWDYRDGHVDSGSLATIVSLDLLELSDNFKACGFIGHLIRHDLVINGIKK